MHILKRIIGRLFRIWHIHQESFEIELLIKDKKIIRKKAKSNSKALKILKGHEFGKGEESITHLFFNAKADAILSDDKKFLNFLFDNNMAFVMPTDFIISLHKKNILDKESSLKVLKGLKPFVRDKHYLQAKNKLEEEK